MNLLASILAMVAVIAAACTMLDIFIVVVIAHSIICAAFFGWVFFSP